MTTPNAFEADYEALKARVEAQRVEYGTYVATQPIPFGNALAYNAGDPVPVSNVKAYGYDKDGLVEKVATEAKSTQKAPASDTPEKV